MVKLGDFVISQNINTAWEKAVTFLGTPYFISPEIVTVCTGLGASMAAVLLSGGSKGKRFALFHSMVGAPLCVNQYEDIMVMGSKVLILLGNCGVLDKSIEDCGIIIPTSALRDEGTSYHYTKASDTIEVNKKYKEEFKEVLKEFGYPYVEGRTWTTDAPYRETKDKVLLRKKQGAICVEMECSAMQALCDFRETEFFQFFYAGDNLDHSNWEPRSLSGGARLDDKTKIMFLAFELGVKIIDKI